MKITRTLICAFLVVLFYGVGYWGFIDAGYLPLFKQLIPFHLLLMLLLMIISHEDKNKYFWMFLLAAYIAGYSIELIGVKTGVIFGDYAYGSALGPKFVDIPLLIGVNWILVIYSAGMLLNEFGIKSHIVRSLIGAFLITALDTLIEPVAIKFDYWSWARVEVPFQNYAGWFIFSYGMLHFFYLMKFRITNFAAAVLFIVQFAFFFALNMKTL